MRKLDYLRNKVKKCKCYDDLNTIKLPSEFRWKKDISDPFFYLIIDASIREVNFHVIHVQWREAIVAKPTGKYNDPSIKTECEDFKLCTKKDFDFIPKGLMTGIEDPYTHKKQFS